MIWCCSVWGGLDAYTEEELLERARLVGEIMPIFGFYLQPSVGGRILSYRFWEQFVQIPQVQAVKIAPFDRYLTLDVVRAVCFSGRAEDLALYTGNDDNIVVDLLTTYEFKVGGETVRKRIVGGLLGHWAVWTKRAVELLERVKEERERGTVSGELLTLAAQITEPTPPSLTRPTASQAVFLASTRRCGRGYLRPPCVSIPKKCSRRGKRRRSTASTGSIPTSPTMILSGPTWQGG